LHAALLPLRSFWSSSEARFLGSHLYRIAVGCVARSDPGPYGECPRLKRRRFLLGLVVSESAVPGCQVGGRVTGGRQLHAHAVQRIACAQTLNHQTRPDQAGPASQPASQPANDAKSGHGERARYDRMLPLSLTANLPTVGTRNSPWIPS
jgi:hypothetical protein